jgi:hypothetical protein
MLKLKLVLEKCEIVSKNSWENFTPFVHIVRKKSVRFFAIQCFINSNTSGMIVGSPPWKYTSLFLSNLSISMDSIFAESTVENVLSKYFNVSSNETPILEEKKKKDFIKNKLQNIEVKNELKRLSESPIQLSTSQKFLNENKNAKFIGKTNKENLVFSVDGNQVKITPRGRIL